jgi:hypothetical protein
MLEYICYRKAHTHARIYIYKRKKKRKKKNMVIERMVDICHEIVVVVS